ncbi:MAG: hypothetical protein JWQ14_2563, partial [Adhaeribacter sp.]|nr:hypothetical protein [Adhaeribacter sp.]
KEFDLTIDPGATFTATIDLKSNSTFNINNSNNFDDNLVKIPAIEIDLIEANSTVNYGGTGNVRQYISDANYYNLNVSGTVKYLYGSSSAVASLGLTSGTVFLNNYNLTVGDGVNTSGNITRDQGYIVTTGTGSLQRFVPQGSTALFPLGTASANNNPTSYNPATIVQSGTSDLLKVRVIDGYFDNYDSNHEPDPISRVEEGVVNRSWIVEEKTAGGSDINLTLGWNIINQENPFNALTSVVTYFNGSEWLDIVNSTREITNNLRQVTGSNLIALGVFGIGDQTRGNQVLPVELISFKAVRVKGEVELNWQTAMEKDNDFFTIEASTDGSTFNQITKVKGAGNSNQLKNYRYLHRNAPTQTTYYRLKQTDFNGNFAYSKVVAVNGTSRLTTLAVYPNPSTGQYTLQGIANITEASVLDATGRTVLKLNNFNTDTGLNLNLTDQKPGVYFLRLTNLAETQTLRLIKK